ncbi:MULTISPECIES: TrmB family transcriptional regulator [Paenibacillus]|uniref:TrmB family transcriptional regulator n=1 Tax=Paenibacillus TaxID=44249 RepID=UPI00038F691D|nr:MULTISPECIES: TrmB family transcriptional regulator [Paenibacillus]KKC47601.1 TrmB family transcriptional regulator [Paenibacillus sp. D9]CDN43527.1 Uncharacterized protein BN871_DC_00110 [Paenibacillus sp. P22]
MIDRLKRLGMSELEARCYLALHEEPVLSGYEVAKRVSVSRTNVYAALRSLVEKGICRVSEGETSMYAAIPIEDVIRQLRSEFEENAGILERDLKPQPPAPGFYTWTGEGNMRTAIRRLIAGARRTVVVDIWSEDFHELEPMLAEAESRGKTVIVITIGEVETGLRHVFTHKRMEMWLPEKSRGFYILCDWKDGLLGSFNEPGKPSALETDHPSVSGMLLQAFHHDLLMMDMERDFGPQLAEAYGSDYEKLLDRYRHDYGWDIP